jgi:4-carboxymuconolactone decarboxylase
VLREVDDLLARRPRLGILGDQAAALRAQLDAMRVAAVGAAPVSYEWSVEAALAADATAEEILGTLIAVAPISGTARVVQATPDVALQLGYDLDAAFEELD